jgi:exopolysaccharide biosynthesis polyprenyl glycosylphosphotransferase
MESSSPTTKFIFDAALKTKIHQATQSVPRDLQWRLFTIGLVISDLGMVGLGFKAAYHFRFDLGFGVFFEHVTPNLEFYQRLILILLPVWLLIFAILGLYDRQNLLGGSREYALVFNAVTVGMFVVIAAGFLDPGFILARGWLLLAWGFAFLFTAFGRFLLRRVVYSLRKRGYFLSLAVIVGANSEGISLAEQLLGWETSGLHVVGFVDEKLPTGMQIFRHLHNLGGVDNLEKLVKQHQIEEIILASSAISSRDKMLEIFKRFGVADNVSVRMSSGLYEIITTGLSVKEFAYVPLVGINKVRLTGIDEVFKLILDMLITIPGVILISPLLIVLAISVKMDSPGPIIHRRRVMGINGRQFDAFKFRTMYVNGDELLENYPELKEELSRNHKLKDDPRVTRMGKILRKTSLDELPQLLNVLRREMSLVGPRIITPGEVEKYNQWDINLLTVRPGITGLWQVSGRSDISYEDRVRLDMYYIRNWSIWMDLQLLFQTIPAVFKRTGAY